MTCGPVPQVLVLYISERSHVVKGKPVHVRIFGSDLRPLYTVKENNGLTIVKEP